MPKLTRRRFMWFAIGVIAVGGTALGIDRFVFDPGLTPEQARALLQQSDSFYCGSCDTVTELPNGRFKIGDCECDLFWRTWTTTMYLYSDPFRGEGDDVFIPIGMPHMKLDHSGPPLYFPRQKYRFYGEFRRPWFGREWRAEIVEWRVEKSGD